MPFKLSFSTIRWRKPDLAAGLDELKKAGWDGWEARLPLDWLGTPQRLRRVCADAGMPLAVYTASGSPDNRDWENVEENKRRIEFAAEAGADCVMFMNGNKPTDRAVTQDDLRYAAEGAEMWAEYAKPLGIELSYHIHTNLLVDSIEDWRFYMSLLKTAKLCIDVSHAELWGYDGAQSLIDFGDQLNYVHLQDYASCTRREDGYYLPVWVDVGQAQKVDFVACRKALESIHFNRWVTCVPGEPMPGAEDPISEAKRSRRMVEFVKGIGY